VIGDVGVLSEDDMWQEVVTGSTGVVSQTIRSCLHILEGFLLNNQHDGVLCSMVLPAETESSGGKNSDAQDQQEALLDDFSRVLGTSLIDSIFHLSWVNNSMDEM